MSDPVEPIAPEQAREILENAMRQRLGDNWHDEESGWQLITGHDYMARVTRGRKNVDFYVDLLGEVTVSESEINSAQDSGRMLAWMFLGLSLAIAFLVARIVGWLK
nr:hypothetical protein [uncultured bacterium]